MQTGLSIRVLRQRVRPVKQYFRSLTSRNFWLRYATLATYRMVCAAFIHLGGRTLSGRRISSISEALENTQWVFDQYKAAAGTEKFPGKVAEVGPGDSCALALMFLAHGCECVDLADRFYFHESEYQRKINQAIVDRYPHLRLRMTDNNSFSWKSFNGLRRYDGESASAEKFFDHHKGYDYIVSAATLEHIFDPQAAVTAMASALNPGGKMIHGIDFRDHGQFSDWFHDLKFLELPNFLYAPLKWKGGPNRLRLSFYTKLLEELGLDVLPFASFVTGIRQRIPLSPIDSLPPDIFEVSMEAATSVRRHLAKPFRDLPDEDLVTAAAVLVAEKPA